MPVQIVDLKGMGEQPEAHRTDLINGPNFYAWFHVYKRPGQRDKMHCHNADQTFYCIDGECTMSFPDGTKQVLKPGMVALITGGSFYQLENTGTGPMILMGNRSGSSEGTQTIGYETRQELFAKSGPPPKGTQILV
jgi:quercetin dioxygenase-like cupin family protein